MEEPQLQSHVIFLLRGRLKNVKPFICTTAVLMTIKLGRVVTCGGETTISKSRGLLIMQLHGKLKKLISRLTQYLWPQNLTEWELTVGSPTH